MMVLPQTDKPNWRGAAVIPEGIVNIYQYTFSHILKPLIAIYYIFAIWYILDNIIDNPFGDHRRPLQFGLSVCGKAILGIGRAIQEVLGIIV